MKKADRYLLWALLNVGLMLFIDPAEVGARWFYALCGVTAAFWFVGFLLYRKG